MKDTFEALFSIRTAGQLRAAVAQRHQPLSLPQARRLQAHAQSLAKTQGRLRLGIVHTYTSELLDPWLDLAASLQGLELATYHAPYGLAMQEANADSALVAHRPDVCLLLLQRRDLHPRLKHPLTGLSARQRDELRSSVMAGFKRIIDPFREQPIGQIVVSLLPDLHGPALGQYDAQSERSESAWWAELKAGLGTLIRDGVPDTLLLDFDELLLDLGREGFFDARLWYSSHYPFTPRAAQCFARKVINIGVARMRPRAKVIVVDADNTLWGGVVGEEGINGILLGPEYPGNLYLAFQRRLLDYRERGFLLAMCSKNNPQDVQQVLDEHPHQLIRERDFAALRVNWKDKPGNLKAMAEELNLGLESFIFVDDSDHECDAVRQALPQVEVVQAPANLLSLPGCLDHLARLEPLSQTEEDRDKSRLYAEERSRRELQESLSGQGGDYAAYLRSLDMRMQIGIDDAGQLKRLAQLTQKTNQFNLTTRRYEEKQIGEFLRSPQWLVGHFSLTDVFGSSGVVGLALWQLLSPERARLDSFLMSCRVIGRQAESAFLQQQLAYLRRRGIVEVVADYLPTRKNALVKDFLEQQGFIQREGRYYRELHASPPAAAGDQPIEIQLIDAMPARSSE